MTETRPRTRRAKAPTPATSTSPASKPATAKPKPAAPKPKPASAGLMSPAPKPVPAKPKAATAKPKPATAKSATPKARSGAKPGLTQRAAPAPEPVTKSGPRRIWVSGANGFIGTAIVRILRTRGNEVIAPVRDTRKAANLVDMENAVREIENQLKTIDDIVKAAHTVKSKGALILETADEMKTTLEEQVEALRETSTRCAEPLNER